MILLYIVLAIIAYIITKETYKVTDEDPELIVIVFIFLPIAHIFIIAIGLIILCQEKYNRQLSRFCNSFFGLKK